MALEARRSVAGCLIAYTGIYNASFFQTPPHQPTGFRPAPKKTQARFNDHFSPPPTSSPSITVYTSSQNLGLVDLLRPTASIPGKHVKHSEAANGAAPTHCIAESALQAFEASVSDDN